MKTTQIVVLALIQKGDKYLFTLRHDPGSDFHNKWQIPGGGMEFAEKPVEALHREVREELGVEVTITTLIPEIDTKVRGYWQGVFLTYLCKLKDESAEIVINEEASEYRWMTIEEVRILPAILDSLEVLDRVVLLSQIAGTDS